MNNEEPIDSYIGFVNIVKALVSCGACSSNSEANRLLKQGAVKVDGGLSTSGQTEWIPADRLEPVRFAAPQNKRSEPIAIKAGRKTFRICGVVE